MTSSDSSSQSVVATNCFGKMRKLPMSFVPGHFDVICARGKKALQHPGNKKFRSMIQEQADLYDKTSSRQGKSEIVQSILTYFRERSVHGGFVTEVNGAWFDVGDQMAREKCGQTFRDVLHTKYKSSTKAKSIRKRKNQTVPIFSGIESLEGRHSGFDNSSRESSSNSVGNSAVIEESGNHELGETSNKTSCTETKLTSTNIAQDHPTITDVKAKSNRMRKNPNNPSVLGAKTMEGRHSGIDNSGRESSSNSLGNTAATDLAVKEELGAIANKTIFTGTKSLRIQSSSITSTNVPQPTGVDSLSKQQNLATVQTDLTASRQHESGVHGELSDLFTTSDVEKKNIPSDFYDFDIDEVF